MKTVSEKMLGEAVEAILNGMQRMFSKQDKRFDKLEANIREIKVELSGVKDSVNGLKAEFSDTPSRREFQKLKAKVDKYHPLT